MLWIQCVRVFRINHQNWNYSVGEHPFTGFFDKDKTKNFTVYISDIQYCINNPISGKKFQA